MRRGIFASHVPFWRQEKYTRREAPIPIARYEEAQLIIAEIERGQTAVALPTKDPEPIGPSGDIVVDTPLFAKGQGAPPARFDTHITEAGFEWRCDALLLEADEAVCQVFLVKASFALILLAIL